MTGLEVLIQTRGKLHVTVEYNPIWTVFSIKPILPYKSSNAMLTLFTRPAISPK